MCVHKVALVYPQYKENTPLLYTGSECADQTAHPRSLICAFTASLDALKSIEYIEKQTMRDVTARMHRLV